MQSRNIQRLWLFERNAKIIGYARFHHFDRYSVLDHLCLRVFAKDLKTKLLQELLSQKNQTIYIACEYHETIFYESLGFKNIDINKLPKNLQLGGRINILCGGSNLVYLK